ncbi:MAG: hypothetical protein QNK11_06045 [Legionella sp.]|nr:hypothetical protein [Legionella sp.]
MAKPTPYKHGILGSLNFSNNLNLFRKTGKNVYNESAMADLTPGAREKIIQKYSGALGLQPENNFAAPIDEYCKAQVTALDKILAEKTIPPDEIERIKTAFAKEQQAILDEAKLFDKTIPGQAKAATHPEVFVEFAREQRQKLFDKISALKPEAPRTPVAADTSADTSLTSGDGAPADDETSLTMGADAPKPNVKLSNAINTALTKALEKPKEALEKNLAETITALHEAARRERDLIGWLAAAECASRRVTMEHKKGTFPKGYPKDYTVMMQAGGEAQQKIEKLHTAIKEKNEKKIEAAGGIHTPSGRDVAVTTNEKQLTFSLTFPKYDSEWSRSSLLRGPLGFVLPLAGKSGYYNDARHNTKADLLFQAALVRNTGAKTIITSIQHNNPKIAKMLAREAYEAAREIGYEAKEITINVNGAAWSKEQLMEEEMYLSGQSVKVDTDISGQLASHTRGLESQLETPGKGTTRFKREMADLRTIHDDAKKAAAPAPDGDPAAPAV